ncbi:ribonuclease D [Trueperella sp. LYQ143]|uniref:ribonuclease D n=1 Tax=unclassified Trueperella TaxID=2630174 RepID=UPI0039832670
MTSAHVRPLLEPRDGPVGLTHDDIDQAVQRLAAGTGPIAVDTERAMGIRYSARAYLIQLRRPGAGTFLIDPVGIEDRLVGLAEVMKTEWILHAADQDLSCLHELGLFPEKVFDTAMAAKLLGREHISLQALGVELLQLKLAKEHATADWSQRPLSAEELNYAALDVELLHELRDILTQQLHEAGRFTWFEEECEEIRTRKPTPSAAQPWRKAARRTHLRDQRSLAMLRELWNTRDRLAQKRDIAPSKIVPSDVLAELARRKPRSRQDVTTCPLLRPRMRQRYIPQWWAAIETAWRLPTHELPERDYHDKAKAYPPITRWPKTHPQAAKRWEILRPAVIAHAEKLGIDQSVLLKPEIQRLTAWVGWHSEAELRDVLQEYGARPWQINEVVQPILHAMHSA